MAGEMKSAKERRKKDRDTHAHTTDTHVYTHMHAHTPLIHQRTLGDRPLGLLDSGLGPARHLGIGL